MATLASMWKRAETENQLGASVAIQEAEPEWQWER